MKNENSKDGSLASTSSPIVWAAIIAAIATVVAACVANFDKIVPHNKNVNKPESSVNIQQTSNGKCSPNQLSASGVQFSCN